jgi:hypothetical protein
VSTHSTEFVMFDSEAIKHPNEMGRREKENDQYEYKCKKTGEGGFIFIIIVIIIQHVSYNVYRHVFLCMRHNMFASRIARIDTLQDDCIHNSHGHGVSE